MVKIKVKPKTITLPMIVEEWKDCTKCEIGKRVRKHVFLDTLPQGLSTVDVLFIGEGPGQVEDTKGVPFIGPAGQLLRQAIKDAGTECPECKGSGYDTKEDEDCHACLGHGEIRIGFTNLIVCRPYAGKPLDTGNRPPDEKEVENCQPRLVAMIKTLKPDFIFLAGKEAQGYRQPLRDQLEGFVSGGYVPIKHPSALLRQGGIESGMLYTQYVDQIKAYFAHYFSANGIDKLQKEGKLPGTPRDRKNNG